MKSDWKDVLALLFWKHHHSEASLKKERMHSLIWLSLSSCEMSTITLSISQVKNLSVREVL